MLNCDLLMSTKPIVFKEQPLPTPGNKFCQVETYMFQIYVAPIRSLYSGQGTGGIFKMRPHPDSTSVDFASWWRIIASDAHPCKTTLQCLDTNLRFPAPFTLRCNRDNCCRLPRPRRPSPVFQPCV